MTRASTGDSTTYVAGTTVNLPVWLTLVRTGARVTGYVSSDGAYWTRVGTTPTALSNAQTELGILVTSHDSGTLNRSTFDHVDVRLPQ
jgi:hypothetical protein